MFYSANSKVIQPSNVDSVSKRGIFFDHNFLKTCFHYFSNKDVRF